MKEFLIKLALDILTDKEARNKILIVILSIVVGVVLLLFAPVAVLMTMGEIEPPDVSGNFDQASWMQSLDSEQQNQIAQMESAGQQIASAMESVGVREQTIKAQLIYISCFDGVAIDDFEVYANLFRDSQDDAALIDSINQTYGLEIVYEDFMRSYALISHVVINPYMFTDAQTKNSTDLVIWARQAYENGWGYVYGTYGNILTEELLQDRASMFGEHVTGFEDFIRENWMRRRTADCVGLIKGYGWYDSASGEIEVGTNGMADVTANGMFDDATIKGTIDTIPEVPGLAVWQDGHIGVYIGNGEVIEAMGTEQGVVKTTLPGNWTHWLEIPYISYATTEEPTTEPTTEESQEG
ncbi:MAG: hypothetical protein IJY85_02420 [Ruminococcus sp.]|nr:hypothetical protein [Ruminococcus sp.]